MTEAQKPSHYPELDALRGIAAFVVLISHSANDGLLPAELGQGFGQMGVGLFYILSAFLLTIIYTPTRPDAPRRYDYFVRRVARVLPLFYAAMALSIALQLVSGQSVFPVLKSLSAFLGNVFLLQGSSVLWSIPVELHFYVVFILFWTLVRRSALLALGALVAVQVILLAGVTLARVESQLILPYWMHFFTIGCAFGILTTRPELFARVRQSVVIRAGIVLGVLALPLALPQVRRLHLGQEPLTNFADPVTVSWVILFAALFVLRIVPPRWLDNRVLRTMGELSFSVYLLHYFVLKPMTVVAKQDILFPGDRFIVVVLAVYGVSALANRLFERPTQKALLRRLLAHRRPAPPLPAEDART